MAIAKLFALNTNAKKKVYFKFTPGLFEWMILMDVLPFSQKINK